MILLIYSLCALTSLLCAVLLHQAAHRTGLRMLMWCGLCFGLLTLANALVIVDHYVLTDVELWPWRLGTTLAGISLLLYGLILEEH